MKYGPEHGGWKGGSLSSHGYVIIYVKGWPSADKVGRIYEHRYIMERHLGRHLRREEAVHHINHNKTDNRIENLRLFASSREHIQFEFANGERKHCKPSQFRKGRPPFKHRNGCQCFRCAGTGGHKFLSGIPPAPHTNPRCLCFRCTKISPNHKHYRSLLNSYRQRLPHT